MKEIWIDPEIRPPIKEIEYMYKGYAYLNIGHLVENVGIIEKYNTKNKYYSYDPLFNIEVYAYRIR